MKIKADFVTNSSSTGYIILDKNNPSIKIYDLIQTWCNGRNSYAENENDEDYFVCCDLDYCETFGPNEIEKFKKFCNFDKELDWIQKITGLKYTRLKNDDAYNISLQLLINKNSIHFVVADKSVLMEEIIKDDIENLEVFFIDGGW